MLTRAELQRIAQARLADADALHQAGRYDGAVYLGGYAVEVGLKHRICVTLNWAEYPLINREFEGLQSLKTHALPILLRLSGIEVLVKTAYATDWSVVSAWNPESRYAPVGWSNQLRSGLFIDATRRLLNTVLL